MLAKDLQIANLEVQELQIGGCTMSFLIHSASCMGEIAETYHPSWWDDHNPWVLPWEQDPNDGSGGTGGGGNGSGASNINDPGNRLGGLNSWLTSTVDALKLKISSGSVTSDDKSFLKSLEKAQNILSRMETSSFNFRIESFADNNNEMFDANIRYDNNTGEVVLAMEDVANTNDVSILIHEIAHIGQLLWDDLWIEGGEIHGYDMGDEVEAYQLSHDIKNGPFSRFYDLQGRYIPEGNYRVTAAEVLKFNPGVYDNLPYDTITKPSEDTSSLNNPHDNSNY